MTFITKLSVPAWYKSDHDSRACVCDFSAIGSSLYPNGCFSRSGIRKGGFTGYHLQFANPYCPPGSVISGNWTSLDTQWVATASMFSTQVTSCNTFSSCVEVVPAPPPTPIAPAWPPPKPVAPAWSPPMPFAPARPPAPTPSSTTSNTVLVLAIMLVSILVVWSLCTGAAAWMAVRMIRGTRQNLNADSYSRHLEPLGATAA